MAPLRHRAALRPRQEVMILDSLLPQARHELYDAVLGIQAHWQLASGVNLPVLAYLLGQQSQRYALLTVTSKLTFIPKRIRPILTGQPRLGSTSSPTIDRQPKSHIFLLSYDQQRHAIGYYWHSLPLATTEPLDAPSLAKQFAKLLKKDFATEKSN